MQTHQDTVVNDDDNQLVSDFPEPIWVRYTLLGLVFAGAVCGMTCMGFLGDIIGRRKAMLMTLGFTVLGSLGAAIFPWGSIDTVYALICCCRFFLGVGVGGLYPLSAAESAESSHANEDKTERVGWAFFWQTPGAMAPYVVALLLTQMQPSAWVTSFQFRLIMGLGAIPAGIVFFHEFYYHKENPREFVQRNTITPLQIMRKHPEHVYTLIGTGGGWFFYDIAYYGTAIFTPQILENIFGKGETLIDICWQSIVVTAIGLPAAAFAIKLLPSKGARWLNIYGFLLLAVLFSALAIVYNVDSEGLNSLKFVFFLYGYFWFKLGSKCSNLRVTCCCFS